MKETATDLVSVIMGVYAPKERAILFAAIASLCASSWTNWELVLVDDGTEGEGRRWIEEAAKMDARIRLFRHPHNQGLAAALNTAIAHSRGSWIARMDGDDRTHPCRLEVMVRYLQTHPFVDWVGCACDLIDAQGVWGGIRPPFEPSIEDYLSHSPFIHPSVMFRGEVLRQTGGYAQRAGHYRCEDYELFLRLFASGYRGRNLPGRLYQYREERDSYQRRTLSAALCEARVRREGARRLDIHGVRAWRCIAKPLAVALVPDGLHARIKRRWYAYNRFQTYWERAGELRPFHVSGDALTQCAAHVVAPVVTAYVAWVLRQALHHGHTRLYFCARDGWLPYHCACLLIKRWQLPVECRYLYVSRAALRQPCYHMDVDRALEWICRDAMQVTLAVLLMRSGIPRSKWQRLITELALPYGMEEPLSRKQLRTVRRAFSRCVSVREELRRASLVRYAQTKAYLRQEGLMDGADWAIVDSGWNGSLALALSLVLSDGTDERGVHGYYLGLFDLPHGADPSLAHPYLFSPKDHLLSKSGFCVALWEVLCSAPHGMTLGYQKVQGRMEPILEKKGNGEGAWMAVMRQATEVQAMQISAGQATFLSLDHEAIAACARHTLCSLMSFPTRRESEALGALVFCDEIVTHHLRPLVVPATRSQLRRQLPLSRGLYRSPLPSAVQSAWFGAAAAQRGKAVRLWQLRWLFQRLIWMTLMYWRWKHASKQ